MVKKIFVCEGFDDFANKNFNDWEPVGLDVLVMKVSMGEIEPGFFQRRFSMADGPCTIFFRSFQETSVLCVVDALKNGEKTPGKMKAIMDRVKELEKIFGIH